MQSENYDLGGEGVAYHDNDGVNSGGQYRTDGVDIENCGDTGGGFDVGYTASGQWLRYTVNVATAGAYTVSFRVASPGGAASALHLQTPTGTKLTGSLTVPATGGWQTYATVTANVTLPAGRQVIEFFEDTGGFNINYMAFASSGSGETPFGGSPAPIPGTMQIENYDLGGEGVAYHDTDGVNSGGQYRTDGVDIENCGDTGGGYDVGWTAGGQWLRYTVNVATAKTYTVSFRIAAMAAVGTNAGSFHLQTPSGTSLSGTITVPGTGGWQTYKTITANVTLPAGQQVLELFEDTGGYNLNYMTF